MNNKDNLIIFPKAKKLAAITADVVPDVNISMPPILTVKNVLYWLSAIVRLPFFLVMYWLRLPIMFVSNSISVLSLIAWLFSWYAFPDKPDMVWAFAYTSLAAFVVSWLYDFILMAISPQSMIKTL